MRAPLVLGIALVVGAAIPGPCSYDAHTELDCDTAADCPTGVACLRHHCSNIESSTVPHLPCTTDNDCVSLGGGGFCGTDHLCDVHVPCSLGEPRSNCPEPNTCAYDPTSAQPLSEGICKPPADPALPLGATCPLDPTSTTNPCGDASCLPTDAVNGICVIGCDETDLSCAAGFNCAQPFTDAPSRPMCMPACDLTNPSCDALFDGRAVCVLKQQSGGGPPSCGALDGACSLPACDADGCHPLCTTSADCDPGNFCDEERFDNCRVDGPDQSVLTCKPPAQENSSCTLTDADSCDVGFACVPSSTGIPKCVQQASSGVIADGAACNIAAAGNVCAKGSYCAPGITVGRCMRFCNDSTTCDGTDQCVRGNVEAAEANTAHAFAAVTVCAATCTADAQCPGNETNASFVCHVAGGDACSAPGNCLPAERGHGCSVDGDCSDDPGTVCSPTGRCALAADTCTP